MIGDEAFTQQSGDREFALIIEEAQDRLRCELRKRKKAIARKLFMPLHYHCRLRVRAHPASSSVRLLPTIGAYYLTAPCIPGSCQFRFGAPGRPHATDRRAAPSTVNAPAEAEQAGLGAFSPLPATKKTHPGDEQV